jgi:hypothetical protein
MSESERHGLYLGGAHFCDSNPGNREAGGLVDGGPLVGTVNVNGKVVNQAGGVTANVPVVIKSGAAFSVTIRTDANGNFAVANIPTPYDAMVLIGNRVTVSVGLTSATPTVLDMFSSRPSVAGPGGSASLSGTVTGGIGFPTPGPSLTSVLFASPDVQTNQYLLANNNTGDYSTSDTYFDYDGDPVPLSWFGPTTTTGTLHALQVQGQFEYDPISYSGYGFKEDVSLADGSAVTGQDIALAAVTPATFAGTYTPPAGYTVVQTLVALKFGSGGLMLIEFDPLATEAFSYNTPNIPGATLVLASTAVKGDAYSVVVNTGLAVDATGVTVAFPAAAEGLTYSSTGVTTGTQFLLMAVPDAVHVLVIGSGASEYSSSVPSYIFLTSGTSATIPDLTSAGLKLPANTDYTWVVYGLGPYADVEAASAGLCCEHQWGYLNSLGGYPFNINLVNSNTGGFLTASATGYFITAP